MNIADAMKAFAGFVWDTPLALLLAGAGLLFTFLTFGIQFKALTHGLAVLRGRYDDPKHAGNISHFQALCAALSGTIGLGNISGVAIAIASGGPGAVFWMWVVGLLGMATKFITCTLGTMYRHEDSHGTFRGGPMYYIQLGLAKDATGFKRTSANMLAMTFAFLGVCGCAGAGSIYQANQASKIFVSLFKHVIPGGVSEGAQFWIQMSIGAILTTLVALVLIGGIKRIGRVASRLVPTMCVLYVLGSCLVIYRNLDMVPSMFASIFENALTPTAGTGAFFGVAVKTAVIQGVRRACFSNEAGMGTAPIAHAAARTDEPIREGVVAALGPFIDTIIICTMTALVVLSTGTHDRAAVGTIIFVGQPGMIGSDSDAHLEVQVLVDMSDESAAKIGEMLFIHKPPAVEGGVPDNVKLRISSMEGVQASVLMKYAPDDTGRRLLQSDMDVLSSGVDTFLFRDGIELTALAFDRGISGFGTYFIPIAAILFAFSTIVTWGFYGETCADFLFGAKATLPFKILFIAMIMVGAASMQMQPVIDWADAMLGLMVVPNLIGAVLLAPRVARASRDYFKRLRAGEFKRFDR